MALFGTSGPLISGLLSNIGGLFGGATSTVGQVLGAGLNIGGSVVGALTQPTANPGVIQQTSAGRIPATAATMTGVMVTAARGVSAVTRAALVRMAAKLGVRSISLSRALSLAKRLGKFMEPAAIAGVLGITAAELAQMIFEGQTRGRRRMNPSNVKALRRSMRRLESFHKLCVRADALRGRGRSRRSTKCATGSPLVVRGG